MFGSCTGNHQPTKCRKDLAAGKERANGQQEKRERTGNIKSTSIKKEGKRGSEESEESVRGVRSEESDDGHGCNRPCCNTSKRTQYQRAGKDDTLIAYAWPVALCVARYTFANLPCPKTAGRKACAGQHISLARTKKR